MKEGEGGGAYSCVACLSFLTIDHAFRSRRSTVPTPNRDTSNVWSLITFLRNTSRKSFLPVLSPCLPVFGDGRGKSSVPGFRVWKEDVSLWCTLCLVPSTACVRQVQGQMAASFLRRGTIRFDSLAGVPVVSSLVKGMGQVSSTKADTKRPALVLSLLCLLPSYDDKLQAHDLTNRATFAQAVTRKRNHCRLNSRGLSPKMILRSITPFHGNRFWGQITWN